MNIFFQISLGLIITFIMSLMIIVIRRYIRPVVIMLLLLLLMSAASLAWLSTNKESAVTKTEYGGIAGNDQYDLYIARELIKLGEYEDAQYIINRLQSKDSGNPEYPLNLSRIMLLQSEYKEASVLYQKAALIAEKSKNNESEFEFPIDEFTYAKNANISAGNYDAALVSYLKEVDTELNNGNEDFTAGDTDLTEQTAAVDTEAIAELINDKMKTEQSRMKDDPLYDGAANAVELAVLAKALYREYLLTGDYDDQDRQWLVKKFNALNEKPNLLQSEFILLSRLELLSIGGDYKTLLGRDSNLFSIEELMVLSELYINGQIKASSFGEDFVSYPAYIIDAVIERCDKIYSEKLVEESKQYRKIYKDLISAMYNERKHGALSELMNMMLDKMNNCTPEIRSKLYMQLSKIENYMGNSSQSDAYIDMAFDKVGDSDDNNYKTPMLSLLEIISGYNDEGIKNASEYVKEILENILPVKYDRGKSSRVMNDIQSTGYSFVAYNEDESESFEDNFAQRLTDYVSKKKAFINIGQIDVSAFPDIQARVQIDYNTTLNITDISKKLNVYDCAMNINNFSLEKLSFSNSRILLLCDVSGSMHNNVSDLKEAVTQFIDSMGKNESTAVVGFDSSIEFRYDFTTDTSILNEAVGKLGAYGDTNMYGALIDVIQMFDENITSNDVIVLMTDGQDNYKHSQSEIYDNIGQVARDKGITIYTLGLGSDVDIDYLTTIADAGDGKFLYVSSSASLTEFYTFIHSQLSSQYLLKYTAADQSSNLRQLKLSLPSEKISDSKLYTLDGSLPTELVEETGIIFDETDGVKVYGFDTKFVYKSSADQFVNLCGAGFASDIKLTLELTGPAGYMLNYSIESYNELKVTIPKSMPEGTYNLTVTANGRTYSFTAELTIGVPNKESTFVFGPYIFKAQSITQSNGVVTLSGNVIMNGWLKFKSDIIIEGYDSKAMSVKMTANSGAYVTYTKGASKGLANAYALIGLPVYVPPIRNLTLYIDEEHLGDLDEYKVDMTTIDELIFTVFALQSPTISLYPNKVDFKLANVLMDLPFQNKLLKTLNKNTFTFRGSAHGIITADNVGLKAKLEYEQGRAGDNLKQVNFLNKMPLWLKEGKLEIDTVEHDYLINVEVYTKWAKPEIVQVGVGGFDSFGFEFGIKGGRVDRVLIKADFNITIVKAPVPITLSKFSLGLTEMADRYERYGKENGITDNDIESDKAYSFIFDSYITGGFNLAAAKLSAIVPPLKTIFKEMSFISLDNASINVRIRDFELKFMSDIKAFDVKVGNCEAILGNFKYTNALLGMYDQQEKGLLLKLGAGYKLNEDNFKIDVNGSAEAVLGSPYSGIKLGGLCDVDVSWGFIDKDFRLTGDAMLGFYTNSSNKPQFSIIVKGVDSKGKVGGFRTDITEGNILPTVKFAKY